MKKFFLIICFCLFFNAIIFNFYCNFANDSSISAYAYVVSDKENSANNSQNLQVDLPIVMYHSVLNSKKSRYIVSEKQLENDFRLLKKNGYKAILPTELLKFVEGKATLPQKPIMITFDDGHYNNIHYALPLLKKYDMKATINIVGVFSEHSSESGDHSNPNYSHITWNQIKEASKTGYLEFGNHTYNMHKFIPRYGIAKQKSESDTEYQEKLISDITKLQEKLKLDCDVDCISFAYPFGKYHKNSFELLSKCGIKMAFTCNEGGNIITKGDANCLKLLKRYNREAKYSSDELIKLLEK